MSDHQGDPSAEPGAPPPECVLAARFANVAAALKCSRFGSRTTTPTRAEVEAFIASWRRD